MDKTHQALLEATEPDLTVLETGWIVQLDPPISTILPTTTSTDRVMLDLNAPGGAIQVGTTDGSAPIDFGDATITEYETQQGQYGNTLADYILPNRTVTINLILGGTGAEDDEETARAQLQQKVALLQAEGGQLLRQRADGPAMYADIVSATLTLPDQWGETGDVEPGVVLTLECLPDFYGAEIALDEVSCSGIYDGVLTLHGDTAVIEGDYPARCRVLITGTGESESGSGADEMWWGFRSRYYSSASSAALVIPATSLISTGSPVTLAGSQSAEVVKVVNSLLAVTVLDLCLTESPYVPVTHVGTYRMLARVQSSVADRTLALTWAANPNSSGGATTNTAAEITVANEWLTLDLGTFRSSPTPIGDACWWGFLQAGDVASVNADFYIDYVAFVPLDESAGYISDENFLLNAPAAEIRTEGVFVQNTSSASYYSQLSTNTGDLPRLPPSGLENRPAQLLVKPAVNVYDNVPAGYDPIESFTVQVVYRPCWLSRP